MKTGDTNDKKESIDKVKMFCYDSQGRRKKQTKRIWRNWQTHKTQNLAVVTSCGFKSHYPHFKKRYFKNEVFKRRILFCVSFLIATK